MLRKGLKRCGKQGYALIVEFNIFYQRLFTSMGRELPLLFQLAQIPAKGVGAQTMGALLQSLLLELLEHGVVAQGVPLPGH